MIATSFERKNFDEPQNRQPNELMQGQMNHGATDSNSSNETVIAFNQDRRQHHMQDFVSTDGCLPEAKAVAGRKYASSSTQTEDRIGTMEELNDVATPSSEISEFDVHECHKRNPSNSNSKLKALLLYTSQHLNPFSTTAHSANSSGNRVNGCSSPISSVKRNGSRGSASSNGSVSNSSSAHNNHQSKHLIESSNKESLSGKTSNNHHNKGYLALIGFFQRHLWRNNSASDLSSYQATGLSISTGKRGSNSTAVSSMIEDAQVSKSAPVTPLKGGRYRNGDQKRPMQDEEVTNSSEKQAHSSKMNKTTAVHTHSAMQTSSTPPGSVTKPCVRFVETATSQSSLDREPDSTSSHPTLTNANIKAARRRLVAELSNDSTSVQTGQSDLIDQSGQVNIVAQLFKLNDQSDELSVSGESPMDSRRFREYGYSLIDYICNYLDTIDKRRVTPLNIEPGYLKSLIKADAPEKGESFPRIMHDFENHIMCGITHWQHPHFHAYFPAGNAYSSILADMLSDALGCVGFSWAASPAYTELEIIMLDWMGKMIGLPEEFLCLSNEESKGGGVIQGSASECVLVNLLAARHWAIERLRRKYPNTPDGVLLGKLIGYCSKEAHSCVEKAAMIGFIRMRALDTDEKHSLRGDTLARAIKNDMENGLEPFIVCATLGTTSCVSFDNLEELGTVCQSNEIWLHVDAAYAGSALICPEFKYLMKGIEMASSFNMNPNKWMLINFDCSLMWVKDRFKLTRAFVVDPLYLQHSFSDQAIDYRHWGIPLSRRFRALKLWFVIRNYGVQGLQAYIRNHVRLAKLFESLIRQDSRFTINNEVVLGLVCFRLVGSNALNQRFLSMINASGKLHMVPASLNGRYVIRFCVCDQHAKERDIRYAYECVSNFASELLESVRAGRERIRAISQQNTIDVSSMSLHTQQSASADRLNLAADAAAAQQAPSVASPMRHSPLKSVLTKQATVQPTLESTATDTYNSADRSESLTSAANETADVASGGGEPSPAGCAPASADEFDDDEDDELSPPFYFGEDDDEDNDYLDDLNDVYEEEAGERVEQARGSREPPISSSAAASLTGDEPATGPHQGVAEAARRRLERRSWSRRSHGRAGSGARATSGRHSQTDEAEDELATLNERRQRMSLRYKREFFVRVVSDPRVYRASISGDINAHASCSSLAEQQQHHKQQQQQHSQPQSEVASSTSSSDHQQQQQQQQVNGATTVKGPN